MLLTAVLLAQVATAAPTATPVPTISAQPKSLSDYARERRLAGSKGAGTFSAAQSTAPRTEQGDPTAKLIGDQTKVAADAQARMDRAVKNGLWTHENIRFNEQIKNSARKEWDAAAENCRKTPGCVPVQRDDGTKKFLKTDDELTDEVAKKQGLSRNKANPNETGAPPQ